MEKDLFWDFVEIVSLLRKKCPWDKSQTLESLSNHLIEETQEIVESISLSPEKLNEELGDLLLVLLMMSEVAEEKGLFDIRNVLEKVKEKVVFRHPHIFGNTKAGTPEEVKKIWNRMKSIEKGVSFLKQASLIQKEASEKGFDWEHHEQVVEKLQEEIRELIESENTAQREEEIGDIIFVTVHLANHFGVDPDKALKGTIDKFNKRFGFVEKKMAESGHEMNRKNIDIMENYWRQKAEKIDFKRGKND
ncbi:nucleoside triphosphate pyrophosphohydrolase [candidate division WOR-3 bacterium]|nr:nucleoside triphosphate pyrophosphohydrolase [candidate division WOR-3 bacterium]